MKRFRIYKNVDYCERTRKMFYFTVEKNEYGFIHVTKDTWIEPS